MQSLLQILQAFAKRTSLPVPSAVVGVPNASVRQMQALVEEIGEDLVSRFNWEGLRRKASWTSTAAENQGSVYTLAGASLERIIPGTLYNETQRVPFEGPVSLEDWQAFSSGLNPSPTNAYAVIGDQLRLWPIPNAGETFSFYWQSSQWIFAPDGVTPQSEFLDDDDMPIFDPALIKMGLRYLWKREKGLPYAEDMRAFEAMAMDKAARGFTRPTLSMAGRGQGYRPAIVVLLNSTIPNA